MLQAGRSPRQDDHLHLPGVAPRRLTLHSVMFLIIAIVVGIIYLVTLAANVALHAASEAVVRFLAGLIRAG